MPAGVPQKSLAAVAEEALRDGGKDADMTETGWAVGRLSDVGCRRVSEFLLDLLRRQPLDNPAWAAHRMVLEALEADITRDLKGRQDKT